MTPAARFVQSALDWLVRIAVAAAVVVSLLWLIGCAEAGATYWVRTHDPVAVRDVRFVDLPCGRRHVDGCFRREVGVIELRPGMNALLLECVLKHERRHAAGYSHPRHDGRPHYSIDCGDGTTYVARYR